MQKLDLNASRWASPEVRREYQSQSSAWSSRAPSPHKQDPPGSKARQPPATNANNAPSAKPLSSAQRQYIARQNDLQRFRKLFRRLGWKANSLTHWSHRALNLSQEYQARLLQHGYAQNHQGHYAGVINSPRATLGSHEMAIDPVEAERQFKIDFYEFYALLERGLVCLLGVWGIVITASVGAPPASGSVPSSATTHVSAQGSIIGDSLSFHGSAHRFHANVLLALEHPSNPLYNILGTGPVREYIGVAKEFRNKWKDVESHSEEAFKGHDRAEEEWDPSKMKRYEEVLRDLKLEELLGSVLSGLEEAGRSAEREIQRLEGLLGDQGKTALGDADFDMQDAPFEVMGEQGAFDADMEF